MVNKKALIEKLDKQYKPMIEQVSIPDFTKCIAQLSGLHIKDVADSAVEDYLTTWAKNKYRFFVKMGNKLRYDTPISYKEEKTDILPELSEVEKEFPSYALWLNGFRGCGTNKITSYSCIDYDVRHMMEYLFPNKMFIGSAITHFFKNELNAPDELVTKLGRIWENDEINGTHTISIDPVDMMLASENPYNWKSCYALSLENSHGDGCLASLLDNSSLITYIWTKEGEYCLYHKYDLQKIRFYRMRQWISVSPNETAIHFNVIYPGKEYSNELQKKFRLICEDFINKDAVWQKNSNQECECDRTFYYGYGEYRASNIYKIKDSEKEEWNVYNEPIVCPCGCRMSLPGSDEDEDDEDSYTYKGNGFTHEHFKKNQKEEWYCEYCESYVTCDEDGDDCQECHFWNRAHAVCTLDENHDCENSEEAEDNGSFDPDDNNIVSCGEHCNGCPFYALHHRNEIIYNTNNNDTLITTTNDNSYHWIISANNNN